MQETSAEFNEIVENGNALYHITITRVSDNKVLNLPIDNFEYIGAKCISDNITFGNAFSQSVKFSIHNPAINLGNEEIFIEQGLYLEDGTLENVPIGYFIVQKPVSDGEVTNYTCYDRMIKLEDFYMNKNKYVNVYDILYDISEITGVKIEKPDISKNYFIDTGAMSEWGDVFTMREVVGYMGGLYAKDAIVDRNGIIVFKGYEDINYTIDGNVMYQGSTTIESEYNMVIEKIVCQKQLPGYAGEEFTAGSGLQTVYIENPFINESILDEMLERVKGLTFRGISTEFLGDFRIDLGDIVNIIKDGKTYKACIMEINHQSDGGVRTKIISHAKTEGEQSYKFTGNISRGMSRDNNALAEVRAIVNEHETEINELFTSVSNGKELIASAITDKGVETDAGDTFSTMADNISKIESGKGWGCTSIPIDKNTYLVSKTRILTDPTSYYDYFKLKITEKNGFVDSDFLLIVNNKDSTNTLIQNTATSICGNINADTMLDLLYPELVSNGVLWSTSSQIVSRTNRFTPSVSTTNKTIVWYLHWGGYTGNLAVGNFAVVSDGTTYTLMDAVNNDIILPYLFCSSYEKNASYSISNVLSVLTGGTVTGFFSQVAIMFIPVKNITEFSFYSSTTSGNAGDATSAGVYDANYSMFPINSFST